MAPKKSAKGTQLDLFGKPVEGRLSLLTDEEKKEAAEEEKQKAKEAKQAEQEAKKAAKKAEQEDAKFAKAFEKEAAKADKAKAKGAPAPKAARASALAASSSETSVAAAAPPAAAPVSATPALPSGGDASASSAGGGPAPPPAPPPPKAFTGPPPAKAFTGPLTVLPEQPLCTKCASYVDPCGPGVRCTSKTTPSFICPVCCSKLTGLNRLCGHWPIEEFKELSAAEQESFFQSCGAGTAALKKAIEQHIIRRQVHQRVNEVAGEFLPLSVWQIRGFDPEIIEKTCPKEIHAQLGPTYQVKIHSTGEKAIEEQVRQHMARVCSGKDRASPKPPIRKAAAGEASIGATDKGGDDKKESGKKRRRSKSSSSNSSNSSNSSSSKSSSSSSDPKKKKKKNKKEDKKKKKAKDAEKDKKKAAKEAKKEKERAEKAKKEKAEAAKRKARVHQDCSRYIAKLAPLIANLREDFDHKAYPMVPAQVSTKAQAIFAELQTMHTACTERLAASNPDELAFVADTVNAKFKDGTRWEQLLSQI